MDNSDTHHFYLVALRTTSWSAISSSIFSLLWAQQCPQHGLLLPVRVLEWGQAGLSRWELTPDGQGIILEILGSFVTTVSHSPSWPMQCVATAGAHYSYSITALGLKSERSLPDTLLPYSELIRTCVIHSARFSFWNFPKWDMSPACFHYSHMVAAAPREELGIWEGKGPQGVLGKLEWSGEELRELLQRLHLQGLLFKSCPRCHSPQLLPIIRCTHFLSKPNNKKEETHTTKSLISLSPPLQISRFIFLDLKNTFGKMLFFSLEKQNAF